MKGIALYLFHTISAALFGAAVVLDDSPGVGITLFFLCISTCLIIFHHRFDR